MAQNNEQIDVPFLIDSNDDDQLCRDQPILIRQDNHFGNQNDNDGQNDPLTLLAQQIGNLVLQMQHAPPPQINIPTINVPALNRELSLVAYPDFAGSEQNPIAWLEDVKKAFEANQVQDQPIDRWDDPGPTEDVDSYHVSIEELLHHVESSGHQYPGTARAQMFINGLRPELATLVAPFMPDSLAAAYERAKAFENSFRQNLLCHNPYLFSSYASSYNNAPYTTSNNWNTGPRFLCNHCGQMGHYARTCPNPLPQNSRNGVATGSNVIPINRNNAAQNNPPPNNINNGTPNQGG
ncbi:13810_t:CDS:2, partial [Dentiscutata heterogama]